MLKPGTVTRLPFVAVHDGQQLLRTGAGIGQEDRHRHVATHVGQAHGLIAGALAVGELLGHLHHGQIFFRAGGRMKRAVLGQLFIEGIFPLALEINGVCQNQVRVGSDHPVGDIGDAAMSLVARPLVDFGLGGGGITEIQGLDRGGEEFLVFVEITGLDLRGLAVPQGRWRW